MMPKIGDVVNDWRMTERIRSNGRRYKYEWKCLACGDAITKYDGAPPLHQCHRRFNPQTDEDRQLVNCWYQSDFDLNQTAILAKLDYKTTCKRLTACEIPPWPRVSPDVHCVEDDYDEVEEDG